MKSLKFLGLPLLLCVVSGCTTTQEPQVIERADSLSSRPAWASTVKPFYEESGKLYFVGFVEVEGDASKSASLNMADEKAMSEPLRSLTDQFLDQSQIGEELRKDASVGQRVISATRGYRPPMPGLKIVGRYWETVKLPGQDDPSVSHVELRSFSLAELPKADYEAGKKAYFARLKGDSSVKKIIDEVGAMQRENAMNH